MISPHTNVRGSERIVPFAEIPIPGEATMVDTSQTIGMPVDGVPLNGGVLLKTLVLTAVYHRHDDAEPGL